MKRSIKLLLVALMLTYGLMAALRVDALTLSQGEVKLMNGISVFIDHRPEGQSLRLIESAMKSSNPALRGMAALILFRHYGDSFRAQLLRNFTLNRNNDRFATEKKVLVKIENINRLLANFDELLQRFRDERARQLFLFYHFRHKQVFMLGASDEKLSLAVFYRIGLFEQVFAGKLDVLALAVQADR